MTELCLKVIQTLNVLKLLFLKVFLKAQDIMLELVFIMSIL